MKPIFRNAMFGFHKDDVANFISGQSKQYEKRISELEEKLREKEEQFEQERATLSQDRVALEDLKEKFSSNFDAVLAIKEISQAIRLKAERIEALSIDCATQLHALKEDNAKMASRLAVAESYREKAEKFDQLAGVLSHMLACTPTNPAENAMPEEIPPLAPEYFDGFDRQEELLREVLLSLDEISNHLEGLELRP